jgi:GTPase SAR1 family protein
VNYVDAASTCHLITSLLNKTQLSEIILDHEPPACIRLDAWQREGLSLPPDEVLGQGWKAVLKFLSAGAKVPVHEIRLMLIGDGEVGKTSLQRSFQAPGHKAGLIGKEERTVGIDISEHQFKCAGKSTIKCQVCDFAGQSIYYFSHSMHFTRRCLYVLLWTTHKFSENHAVQELTLDDIVTPLKRWLQLLASNVPEANLMLVGTHCRVEPEKFDAKRLLVEQHVHAEMQRLRHIASAETVSTREVLKRLQTRAQTLIEHITAELSDSQVELSTLRLQLADVQELEQRLNQVPHIYKRGVMQKVKLLSKTVREFNGTQQRLCRLHAVYDGAVPAANVPLAHLKLVYGHSFAVDSIEGVGVAEILNAIEATCRDKQLLPFIGELVPQIWLRVMNALEQKQAQDVIGNSVMSLADAVSKVRVLLQTQLDDEFGQEKQLEDQDLQCSLEFWSLLGRVFVHDGHFLREPRLIIDLLKPLVHHNILHPKFQTDFLVNPSDFSCYSYLRHLHDYAVLDHRLLQKLAVWATSSPEAQRSMIKFFESTFMVITFEDRGAAKAHGTNEPQQSLISARLFDCSDGERQRKVAALANDIAACGIFHSLYMLPSAYVGLMAHLMATLETLQPLKIHISANCAQNHVCMERGSSRCAVSMQLLPVVFGSKLGSIKDKIPQGHFANALVISSNDDGMFLFAARCVDSIMQSGSFGAAYQCWLPYRSWVADGSWQPKMEDWLELSSADNSKSLSEVLSANSSEVVIPSHNLKLRDVLPRKPRIFMSHVYSGDGTGECCQRIKNELQDRLMCTVWFDKAEMGWTDSFIDEMKRGTANASVFIICLTTLYLTRPNCLRELMWAMDICAVDKKKKLCVLPMHPSVSFAGCRTILNAAAAGCSAQVILPVDDRCKHHPMQLKQLKGHKLSSVAIELLQRLTGQENVGMNAEWLKLQPWRSDAEGENWEELSKPWAGPCEGNCLELTHLLESLSIDIQTATHSDCVACDLSVLRDLNDQQLQSDPPSQDYLIASDTALLRSTFPQLLQNFKEDDVVKLLLLGMRDNDAVGCIQHGFKKMSAVCASQLNPVDQVSRMVADISGCFSSPRCLAISGVYVKSKSHKFPALTKQTR